MLPCVRELRKVAWMMCPVDSLHRVLERVEMRRAPIGVTVAYVDFIVHGTLPLPASYVDVKSRIKKAL